jgi:hemerythrin-like domain-containing protein
VCAHLDVEEATMIPLLSRSHPKDARAILEEHKHLRKRLRELVGAAESGALACEMLERILDELRAHAAHEERLFYSWAEARLSDEERAHIAHELHRSR